MSQMHDILENLRGGDHAALFYRTRAEQFAVMVPFIKIGLSRGEHCLYIANDNSVALIMAEFQKGGVDVEAAQRSGALTISTKSHTYLRHGIFEPEKMVSGLADEVQQSLRLGFTGLRATGEMAWVLTHSEALAQLQYYETQLHAQFPNQLTGLCQYDERGFSDRVIADMIRIHPLVVARGKLLQNSYHQPGATPENLHPELVTVDQVVNAGSSNSMALAC